MNEPTPKVFRTTEPVSEAVRTAQIEIAREKLRDRTKREVKRFKSKLPHEYKNETPAKDHH